MRCRNCEKLLLPVSCMSMSVYPSIRPRRTTLLHWTDFHEILYLCILRKSVEKIQVPLKSDKNSGTGHEDRYTLLITSSSILLRIWNISDKFHIYRSAHRESNLITVQQDATVFGLLYFCRQLYMFRV